MKTNMIILSIIILPICCVLIVGGVFITDSGNGVSPSGFLTSLPPNAPKLFSPNNGVAQLPDTIKLIWRSQIHSSSYTLQVSKVINFQDLVINKSGKDTSYSLSELEKATTYYWRVCASNVAGSGQFSEVWGFTTASPTSTEDISISSPEHFELLPAYPNPFNSMTTITYRLPETAKVSIVIYDSMGQLVKEIVSENKQAGEHKSVWDGRNNHGLYVTSGLYFVQFDSGKNKFTQKIILIR